MSEPARQTNDAERIAQAQAAEARQVAADLDGGRIQGLSIEEHRARVRAWFAERGIER